MNYTEASLQRRRIREMSAALREDNAAQIAAHASVKNGLMKAATNYAALQKLPYSFCIDLKQGSITDQKASGRCWLFSALNTLRFEMIHRFDLEDFELSQSYLFFFDKLERSNFFLENILQTTDEPLDGRLMQFLLQRPAEDGGQWDMFANLVRKYGVVPKNVYPDSANATQSRWLNQYLGAYLRECARDLRARAAIGV